MRIVIQRVTHAAVRIGDRTAGEIGPGLLLLLGVGPEDTEEQADYLAAKTVNMRIFEDENGKMNRSVKDIGGEILVVSQFTFTPTAERATGPASPAPPLRSPQTASTNISKEKSESWAFRGLRRIGAEMKVSLENDGPVTILLER